MAQTARQALKILQIGAQRLITPARQVIKIDDPHIQDTIHKMLYTVSNFDRLGMAANQFDLDCPVDQTPKIVVFRFPKEPPHPRYKALWKSLEQTTFFNNWQEAINLATKPITEQKSKAMEPCASFPGFVQVQRADKIEYSFYDKQGKLHTGVAKGPFARLLQHEEDHTNGVMNITKAESWHDVVLNHNLNKEQQELIRKFYAQSQSSIDLDETTYTNIHNSESAVNIMGNFSKTHDDHGEHDYFGG